MDNYSEYRYTMDELLSQIEAIEGVRVGAVDHNIKHGKRYFRKYKYSKSLVSIDPNATVNDLINNRLNSTFIDYIDVDFRAPNK